MELSRLNLEDLEAVRDLELGYPVHEAMRYRIRWGDMNVLRTPSLQDLVGQPGALSQDAFSALIVRQGSVGGAPQAFPRHALQTRESGGMDHEHGV